MAEKKEETLLDKFNAMFGKVEVAQKKIFKAKKHIYKTQYYKFVVKTLREVLVDLRYAYRLSLHRRSKKLIKGFRTLEALPHRQAILKRRTANLQILLEEIRVKIERIIHAKNDEDMIRQFQKNIEKNDMEDVKLLFTWAKEIVDQLKDVPELEKHWAEALGVTGLFAGAKEKELAKIINEYLEKNERIFVPPATFKSFIKRRLFGILIFGDCTFECDLRLYNDGRYIFEKCNFNNCQIYQDLGGEENYAGFKHCNFTKVSGQLGEGNKEKCTFHQCHKLTIYLDDNLSSMTGITFSESSFRKIYLSFMILRDIEFDSCNIDEIYLGPPEPSAGFKMKPTNIVFKNCYIKRLSASRVVGRPVVGDYEGFWLIECVIEKGNFKAQTINGLKIVGGNLKKNFKLNCRYDISHSTFMNTDMGQNFFPNKFRFCTFDIVNFSKVVFSKDDEFSNCHFSKCLFEKTKNKKGEELFVRCIGNPSLRKYFNEIIALVESVIRKSDLKRELKEELLTKGEDINEAIKKATKYFLLLAPELTRERSKIITEAVMEFLWPIMSIMDSSHGATARQGQEIYRQIFKGLVEVYERQVVRQEAEANV
ncbi:MAG: hypothetical protein KAT77_05820 [Nanoarchaeota archaeon]|nr:hypothetical protein [Nanoarchaeota archaeon]